MRKHSTRWSLVARITLPVVLLSALASIIIAVTAYITFRQTVVNDYADNAAQSAITFASTIDAALFVESIAIAQAVEYRAPDKGEYWNTIQSQLDAIRTRIHEIAYVYILMVDGNDITYYAEGLRPGENPLDYPTFGTLPNDDDYDQDTLDAFHEARTVTTPIYYTEEYGNLISSWAPILDSNGRAVGLVGFDFYGDPVVASYNRFAALLFAIGIITAVVTGVVMRWRISGNLAYSLKRIVNVDHTFSNPNSSFTTRPSDAYSSDEICILYAKFDEVINTFKVLSSDVRDMADKHLHGFYDTRLDESKYSGGHLEMAKSINAMTNSYVKDFTDLINLMKGYGEGDFSRTVAEYPGDWEWANKAIADLQNSFAHITAEIKKLADNAAQGEFSVKAETGKYKGEWAIIIQELNGVLASVEAPLGKLKDNMTLMAQGNFSPLTGDFRGEFNTVRNVCNETNKTTLAVIEEVAQVLGSVAAGDLRVTLKEKYLGSYAPIRDALTTIVTTLNRSMSDIVKASSSLLAGSQELSQSAEQLAQGTSGQASTVEELHASIESIRDKTKFNSERANIADDLAQKSNIQAQSGDKNMKSTLETMDGIKDSSANISRVIKVIEDIAFQTNLLALNAAVEAARAGVHGAGFSVVAEEVRNLAARSQVAAQETTGLIENSVSQVNKGTQAVQDTAVSLNTIVEGARQVSDQISQIAVVSNEQSEALEQLVEGINVISRLVETNVSVSENCASVASTFNSQAQMLKDLVAHYKLK